MKGQFLRNYSACFGHSQRTTCTFLRIFQYRGREGTFFKPTIQNGSVHENSDGNVVRVILFAT